MQTVARTLAMLDATPGWADLARGADLDGDTIAAILDQAARFAEGTLRPLGRHADAAGCHLRDGRVVTPDGYREAYSQLAGNGWLGVDLPADLGGQGLPTTLHAAASAFFEAEATAFMMLAGASRPAAHLLAAAAPDVAAEWAPRLASGERSATICISEPGAGSDVGRIATRAVAAADGSWRVSGSKCWISFGDHDVTERIGHCMLARTDTPAKGTRGLSLFLVPNTRPCGSPNGVSVERIEEKLGLHGSPTCVLGFEESHGILLGTVGGGVGQMFAMIELMRLQTACQGLGIARRATEIAFRYAAERRQGGRPHAPPPPLTAHADIRRQLTMLDTHTELLRAAVLETAVALDRARAGDADCAVRAALLLPLVKTFGGETAFDVASGAIQVLGGAGYTREWPVEQLLRDARVITIYEGTTGMQAHDFLHRRLLRDGGAGLAALLRHARSELEACPVQSAAAAAREGLERFEALVGELRAGGPVDPGLAADGVLRAGWVAVSGWLACRLVALGGELARLGRFRLSTCPAEMTLSIARARIPNDLVAGDA